MDMAMSACPAAAAGIAAAGVMGDKACGMLGKPTGQGGL
jgi:hypothetical protein